jgi:hypothetical protein
MLKTEYITDEKQFPNNYDTHFNHRPEGSVEISEEEFFNELLCWNWDFIDSKQITDDVMRFIEKSRIFMMSTRFGVVGIYVGISSKDNSKKFYKFGPWKEFYGF